MKLIVGLGNPESKYELTRHNTGFLAIDYYLEHVGVKNPPWDHEFKSLIHHMTTLDLSATADDIILESKEIAILFAKPQTYMNNSGVAVRDLCHFYKVKIKDDLLVIHDDSDLPLGTLRSAVSSSSAGHNGVQDIIDKLGMQDFHRIRIGVETRLSRKDLATDKFVLQNFKKDELKKLQEEIFPEVKKEIDKFLTT